ncbi:MAG: T9SS type A sorting domain-containing protein, partial [candidate division WOR-3 bacterium]
TPNKTLSYYTWYSLEQDWDYAHFDLNNGSHFWWTFDIYTGNQTSWVQKTFNVNRFFGKTTRMRFRFISDYSVTQEGWYVDDVYVPFYVEISEKTSKEKVLFNVYPNIFRENTVISFSGIRDKDAVIKIFNSAGEIINMYKINSAGKIIWDGKDKNGKKLPSGIYFINLNSKEENKRINVIILR